jgi:hypothetical protein
MRLGCKAVSGSLQVPGLLNWEFYRQFRIQNNPNPDLHNIDYPTPKAGEALATMDPLSALSIEAAVVQFVDFSTRLRGLQIPFRLKNNRERG